MPSTRHDYVPAAGHDWALPIYDPMLHWLGLDRLKWPLVEAADLRPGQTVLDIGCGTGTLAIALKQRMPSLRVTGLDPDPKALAIAQRKRDAAGVEVAFQQGLSNALPHGPATFDHVFSTFMFHHLSADEQRATLEHVRRVLAPGGQLHLLDFRGASTRRRWLMRALRPLHRRARHGHGHGHGHAHAEAPRERQLRDAGFVHLEAAYERVLLFGRVGYFHARMLVR